MTPRLLLAVTALAASFALPAAAIPPCPPNYDMLAVFVGDRTIVATCVPHVV